MLVVFIRALLLIATIASTSIFMLLLVVYGDLKEDDDWGELKLAYWFVLPVFIFLAVFFSVMYCS